MFSIRLWLMMLHWFRSLLIFPSVLVAAISGVGPTWAASLPEHSFREWLGDHETFPIPGGMGIEYFYGEWRKDLGGGPVTITPTQFHYLRYPEANPPRDYRLLFEGRDYVLFVFRTNYIDDVNWTRFGTLILYDEEQIEPSYVNDMSMGYLSCTDDDMKSPDSFDWSDERLLEEFHGQCGAERARHDNELLFDIDWHGSRFYRVMPKYGYPE